MGITFEDADGLVHIPAPKYSLRGTGQSPWHASGQVSGLVVQHDFHAVMADDDWPVEGPAYGGTPVGIGDSRVVSRYEVTQYQVLTRAASAMRPKFSAVT